MENAEYKEIMNELFKFLRDKISLSLGQYLTNEQKEKLYSFDFENIVLGKRSNKIIEYSSSDDKIYISDGFLTPEYINKTKDKNPEFDIIDLKNRVNEENPKILLEEFIAFSDELKITEKDLIKSLFIQEMLRMILMNDDMDAKEDAIMTGTIELLAHTLGNQNGFLVSTPKKYIDELDIAIGLKNELEEKFESVVLKGNALDYLSRIENSRLLQKIDELADNRKIIESTQNLDNVIDSIVNMTEENEAIINDNENNKEESALESNDKKIAEEDETEQIVEINDNTEETKEIKESNEVKEESLSTPVEDEVIIIPNKNKKLILSIVLVVLTIILGVIVGYLLFRFK